LVVNRERDREREREREKQREGAVFWVLIGYENVFAVLTLPHGSQLLKGET
jgi:hypothetical protein